MKNIILQKFGTVIVPNMVFKLDTFNQLIMVMAIGLLSYYHLVYSVKNKTPNVLPHPGIHLKQKSLACILYGTPISSGKTHLEQ